MQVTFNIEEKLIQGNWARFLAEDKSFHALPQNWG